jgi:hypothetical protein
MKQKDNQVKQLPAIYKLRLILTIIRKKIAKFQIRIYRALSGIIDNLLSLKLFSPIIDQ